MAETLTYDAGTDTVTTSDTLNSDEQESLEVGEALEEQQESLLAGKYKNAEELEKAHIELQRKLGDQSAEDEPEEGEEVEEEYEEETEDEPVEGEDILDTLWQETISGNDFSEETLQELASKRPGELAKMYLQFRNQVANAEPQGLTEENVEELKDSIGGEDQYQQIIGWANDNLSEDQVALFDSVIDKGDPAACYFAVQALNAQYENAVGSDGDLVTGRAPSSSSDVFRSQPEVVEAMSDPRYDNDPAYRRDVMNKLERSNIDF